MEQNKIVTYYVIKDLATWTTYGCKQSVCERYEHAEEAMQQFRDYAQWQTVIEDKRIRATLGIRIKGLDFDVVYRIGGKNALSLEFHLSSSVNENQNFLVALQNICQQLPVSHVRIHRQMTEEEKKEWTRERFTKWVLLNNVHGIIQDLEKKNLFMSNRSWSAFCQRDSSRMLWSICHLVHGTIRILKHCHRSISHYLFRPNPCMSACRQVKWNLIIPCMTHRSIYWMAAG